jgi:hypothetical protein
MKEDVRPFRWLQFMGAKSELWILSAMEAQSGRNPWFGGGNAAIAPQFS